MTSLFPDKYIICEHSLIFSNWTFLSQTRSSNKSWTLVVVFLNIWITSRHSCFAHTVLQVKQAVSPPTRLKNTYDNEAASLGWQDSITWGLATFLRRYEHKRKNRKQKKTGITSTWMSLVLWHRWGQKRDFHQHHTWRTADKAGGS